MPRFAILEHDHPHLHWDLFLEAGPELRSWRLAEPPQPGKYILATPIGTHRLAYLDYEGPVSGNRGIVKRWDGGTFLGLEESERGLRFILAGDRVMGLAVLQADLMGRWQFRLGADRAPFNPTERAPP